MNKLMPNYGWVQNSSNLSTVRDTADLVPEEGIRHANLMMRIKNARVLQGKSIKYWSWDSRCRIKALHATGLIKIDRPIKGYILTELGNKLRLLSKGKRRHRGFRVLTPAEVQIFQQGLLTNPPVIRVLQLLESARKNNNRGLSKYDIGKELGFVGDVGFTHIDPHWVAINGFNFGDKEGDADKWARTILSWLMQVGWIRRAGYIEIEGKRLQVYLTKDIVENVLRYDASRISRSVPIEMLCSQHHPFPQLIKKRRALILKYLSKEPVTRDELVESINRAGIKFTQQDCEFELINLMNVGFRITENGGYLKLVDKIELDAPELKVKLTEIKGLEKLIEELVVKYDKTLPIKLVDHLIRFGCDSAHSTEFESIVAEFFRNLGYKAEYLGQGRGRVTDVLVKYIHPSTYAKSYGIIIDAKSTSGKYSFPVGDKRKMKDYIRLHGPKLMSEAIQRHAFAFASYDFINKLEPHLQEISVDTDINGCAIDVFSLLEMGHQVNNGTTSLQELYPKFVTNRRFTMKT